MNRRSLLQGLATLPFVPALTLEHEARAEAPKYPPADPLVLQKLGLTPSQAVTLATTMLVTMLFKQEEALGLKPDESASQQAFRWVTTHRVLAGLLRRDDMYGPYLPDYPNHDISRMLSCHVGMRTVSEVKDLSDSKRTRAIYSPDVIADLRAYHGREVEIELMGMQGEQVLLELQCEIYQRSAAPASLLLELPFRLELKPGSKSSYNIVSYHRLE